MKVRNICLLKSRLWGKIEFKIYLLMLSEADTEGYAKIQQESAIKIRICDNYVVVKPLLYFTSSVSKVGRARMEER